MQAKAAIRASIPPEAIMHYPPCFRFPPIFEKFSDSVENFTNFTFSRKISRFSSAEISDDLILVTDHKFRILPPIFPVSVHFPTKIIISPYFEKFPPVSERFTCFFTCFMCISFSPTLTMMHLCITQCTYWTPLAAIMTKLRFHQLAGIQRSNQMEFINSRQWMRCA